MTIALANIAGQTREVGEGTSRWSWSGGGSWNLIEDLCTNGTPVEPSYDGTTSGEEGYGSCSLKEPVNGFINTLLQDPDGVYDDLVERYHTHALSRLLCQNAAVVINRGNGCIIHNYEPLPTPKINQLVIPTGATRWSYCVLLADDDIKDQIYSACDNGSQPMTLIFGTPVTGRTESQHAVTLTVHVLPPRQVSPNSDDTSINKLWLIPVVDERYYWQFKHTDNLSEAMSSEETDYSIPNNAADFLLELAAGTNFKNIGVNTAYDEGVSPSLLKKNDYENLPIVVDSLLAHFGQRLVVDIGNWNAAGESYASVSLETPPSGRTRFVAIDGLNSVSVFNKSMEGKLGLRNCTWVSSTNATPSAAAESYTVGRPFVVAGGVGSSYGTAEGYTPYGSTPASVDIQTVAGTYVNKKPDGIKYKTVDTKAIWRTEYDEEPPGTLVTQIGIDYFYQFYRQFDFTFAGVQPWQQTYFDDYMVIRQTWNSKTECYDAYTRVCSRQPNLQGEWTSNQDLALIPGIVTAKRDCNPGYYTVQLATWNGSWVNFDPEDTDPCPTYTVTGDGTTACAITLNEPSLQVTGRVDEEENPITVLAYDCQSTVIPLKLNKMVLMKNMGHTVTIGEGEEAVTTAVWQIVRGRLNEEVYYEDNYDCCDAEGESGVETLISRVPSIVTALRLPSIDCGSC